MKKKVLSFVLGLITATSLIGIVYALNASDIDYKDTKVDQALDNLYTEVNKDLIDRLDLTTGFQTSYGYRTGNGRSVAVDLTKGDYLLVFSRDLSWLDSGFALTPSITDTIEETITNSEGITCEKLIAKNIKNKLSNGQISFTVSATYKCSATTSGTTTFSITGSVHNGLSENMILYSIKID